MTSRLLFSLILILGLGRFPPTFDFQSDNEGLGFFELLNSDSSGFTLEFHFPNYELESKVIDGIVYQRLTIPDTNTFSIAGSPELPVKSLSFGLPQTGGYRISVTSGDSVSLPGEFRILPSESEIISFQDEFPLVSYSRIEDESIYQVNAFFPDALVSGSSDSIIRQHRIANLQVFPFQYNPVTGELLWTRTIRIRIDFDDVASKLMDRNELENSPFDMALGQELVNYDTSKDWLVGDLSSKSFEVNAMAEDFIERVKLIVNQDGLYRVAFEDLTSAGVTYSAIPYESLGFSSQGESVAILPEDENANGLFETGEAFLFYGQKLYGQHLAELFDQEDTWWNDYSTGWRPTFNATMVEKYTDENVYWIDFNGAATFMEEINGTPINESLTPPLYFRSAIHAEQNNLWRTFHFNSEDTWFWNELTTSSSISMEFPVELFDVAISGGDATIYGEVNAQANNPDVNPDHHTRFWINTSALVEDSTWDGKISHQFSGNVSNSALISGINNLKLEVLTDVGQGADAILFNWFEVEYDRLFKALNGELIFTSPQEGESEFEVENFVSSVIFVLDVTDPLLPRIIQHSEIAAGMVTFQTSSTLDSKYYLAGEEKILNPTQIDLYNGKDLHAHINGADYIVISDPIFDSQAQRLIDHRTNQGLRSRIVHLDDIYNQFSFGIEIPAAIHAFLDCAYHEWHSPAPTFIVLIGDGHWNFKGYNPAKYGTSPIYMPPNLAWVDDIQGEVDSSSLLAAVDGDDPLPDMLIGRIPVNTTDELSDVNDKIISYENIPINPVDYPWQNRMIASAYFPDEAGDFPAEMDSFLTDYSSLGMVSQKVYLNDYPCSYGQPCPEARDDLINGINNGASVVLYNGHGGVNGWGYSSRFFSNSDVASLSNLGEFPIIYSLTCLDGYWNYADKTSATMSLAESFIKKEAGGAVAAFSPTGFGSSDQHDWLFRGFFDQITRTNGNTLGSAVLGAKMNLFGSGIDFSIINSYTIFGDPATQLRIPATLNNKIFFPFVKN
jgi:hypothetical protein